MFDYNFFQDNGKKKKPKSPSMIIVSLICLFLILGIAGAIGWTYTEKSTLQTQLNDTKDQIRKIEANDDIARIMEKENLFEALDQVASNIDQANTSIQSENRVTENILALISDNIPIDVQLDNLNISEGQMSISGRAFSRPAIAEFAHNLRQTDSIEDVFVPNIEQSEEETVDYSFSMQVLIGGGLQ
jgi:type IV pilus assembly protein PilN